MMSELQAVLKFRTLGCRYGASYLCVNKICRI